MNSQQRTILLAGLVAAFGMFLYPPWHLGGYALIFNPPENSLGLDVPRLAVQLLLVILSCGIATVAAPQIQPTAFNGITTNQRLIKSAKIFLIGLTASAILLTGYYYWKKDCEEKAARDFIEQENKNRLKIRKEHADAALEAAKQQKLADEKEKQRLSRKLNKYATPRRLLIAEPLCPGVTTYLHSFWKDNQLIYCLSMRGSPEQLEYAADANQKIELRVMNKDGLNLFELPFETSQFKPLRNKSRAITSLATSRQATECDVETYEAITEVRLAN